MLDIVASVAPQPGDKHAADTDRYDLVTSLRQRAWAAVGVSPALAERMRLEHAELRANAPDRELQRAEQVLNLADRRRLMRAIAVAYGRTYFAAPDALLWLGFAAIAINDGVAPAADLAIASARLLQAVPPAAKRGPYFQLAGLAEDGIKAGFQVNFAIFADLYWAHLAYLSEGLLRLRSMYQSGALARELLDAFTLIDEGRQSPDCCTGAQLIDRGNRLLFRHEQRLSVTPVFTTYHRALSAATRLGLITLPNKELQASCQKLGRSPFWPQKTRATSYGPFAARWDWLESCGWESFLTFHRDRQLALQREVRRAIAGLTEGTLDAVHRLVAARICGYRLSLTLAGEVEELYPQPI